MTSTSVVRYPLPGRVYAQHNPERGGNDYSMPVAFGHREVWIKCFVDRVVFGCVTEVIAEHTRTASVLDL